MRVLIATTIVIGLTACSSEWETHTSAAFYNCTGLGYVTNEGDKIPFSEPKSTSIVHLPAYSEKTTWYGSKTRSSPPDRILFCNEAFSDFPDTVDVDLMVGVVEPHDCTNMVTPITETIEFLQNGGMNQTYQTTSGTFTFNHTWDANEKHIAILSLSVSENEQPYGGSPMIVYIETSCIEVASFDEHGQRDD